ncbi:MAG: L-tyrosine/L-tryptophan isonitrile synthase family protein [Taibaiella sp.]|nr:L-tyrosine/L-tryptophan isonitrile synthase family protein [Taibaiella sp.]
MNRTDTLPYKICQAAMALFKTREFESVTMPEIANAASVSEATLFRYFGHKQDLVLFLYYCINSDWQHYVAELSKGRLADRFRQASLRKIELIQPYASFLSSILPALLQDKTVVAVQGVHTSHIRAMGLQTFETLIQGATDAKRLQKRVADLPSLLFIMHWGLMFLDLQARDAAKTNDTIDMMSKMIQRVNDLSILVRFLPFINELSTWSGKIVTDDALPARQINTDILHLIFKNRKLINAAPPCIENKCADCIRQHELSVDFFTRQQLPLQFVLPAFPAKSPNASKVLGQLPDLGEEIALHTLQSICDEIKSIYAPGAQVIICSDGRIFAELVGVSDEAISNYVAGIRSMIDEHGLNSLSIVNLEDLVANLSFDAARSKVLEQFSDPLEQLQESLKTSDSFKSLFNGIHRFIVEDRKFMEPELSVSKAKEAAKPIALKVIQHSNAWTRFLNYVYPNAIRFSIHPYAAHTDKIGIRITKATDNWLTPWHGVIVLQDNEYILMKKQDAEQAGARLMYNNGRPYYYALTGKQAETPLI